jgi:hypothetical protein
MNDTEAERWRTLVGAVLRRFCAQNGRVLAPTDVDALAAGLRRLIEARGLPPRLAVGEQGAPRDWPKEEVAPLVAQALEAIPAPDPLLATAARQLVKACFQPEFKACRDSYREGEDDGSCRRQQLDRVRERVSGSHCVDCPYWTALTPDQHERLLRRAWAGDAAEFATHRDIFLPEDFRALRVFLRKLAPPPQAGGESRAGG